MEYITSKKQRDRVYNYDHENVDRILLRLIKKNGITKADIQEHIQTTSDSSVNGFISRAIKETIERDRAGK